MRINNILLYILLTAFLAGCLFVSCGEEYEDNEAPKIEVMHINDVFYLDSTFSTNDSAVGDNKNLNLIKLRFTDNKALSSYIISLVPGNSFIDPDKPIEMGGVTLDSLAYNGIINSRLKDIFEMTDVYTADNLYIKSNFQVADKESATLKTYKTRPGKYVMSIKCIDKAGNETSAETKEVLLIYPPAK